MLATTESRLTVLFRAMQAVEIMRSRYLSALAQLELDRAWGIEPSAARLQQIHDARRLYALTKLAYRELRIAPQR